MIEVVVWYILVVRAHRLIITELYRSYLICHWKSSRFLIWSWKTAWIFINWIMKFSRRWWKIIMLPEILISHSNFKIPIDFAIFIMMILTVRVVIWRLTLMIMTVKEWIAQLACFIIQIIIFSETHLQRTLIIIVSLINILASTIYFFRLASAPYSITLIEYIQNNKAYKPKYTRMLFILRCVKFFEFRLIFLMSHISQSSIIIRIELFYNVVFIVFHFLKIIK